MLAETSTQKCLELHLVEQGRLRIDLTEIKITLMKGL